MTSRNILGFECTNLVVSWEAILEYSSLCMFKSNLMLSNLSVL